MEAHDHKAINPKAAIRRTRLTPPTRRPTALGGAHHKMTHQSQIPATRSIKSLIVHWLQKIAAPLLLPSLKSCEKDLATARDDIHRLRSDLDDMANMIEAKDRQLHASAEALAIANGDAARYRRLANQLQTNLDNERRLIKQMSGELAEARKNRKRR